MPTINRLHIERFRSLREVDLDGLPPFGVLIGPNGAGKSNLLLALRLLSFVGSRSFKRFVVDEGGASALLYRGNKSAKAVIEVGMEDEHGAFEYRVVLRAVANDGLVIEEDAIRAGASWVPVSRDEPETRLEPAGGRLAKRVLRVLQRCKGLHVHDTSPLSPLRSNGRESDDQYLRYDGSNLAPYLKALRDDGREAHGAAFRRIVGLVRQVAPFIKELDPTSAGGDTVRLDWVDAMDDRYSVAQLSDGTLRAIALMTMLAQPVERLQRFVAIDEPELGLHPSAIALVCDLARAVSSRCQILCATQSPMVLPAKDLGEVLVVDRDEQETKVRRLAGADLEEWLEDYTLPQLWDMNVFGARP